MSSIGRWSYKNVMTVRPWLAAANEFDGTPAQYGAPYQIACTWTAKREQMRDARGQEFTTTYQVWHEARSPEGLDVRVPQMLDLITLGAGDGPADQEVRDTTYWDMSPFGDVPDYMTVT